MTMETNVLSKEMQELKAQFELLSQKLYKEEIVTDSMLRSVMRDKMRGMERNQRILNVIAAAAIPYTIFACHILGYPIPIIVVTAGFLLLAVAYGVWNQRRVKAKEMIVGDLVDVRRRLIRMKHYGAQWLKIGIPFICLWFPWFVWETVHLAGTNNSMIKGLVTGAVIGFIVGLTFGLLEYRKQRRTITEIIEQLHEVTGQNL